MNQLKQELIVLIEQVFEEIEMEFNRIVGLKIEDNEVYEWIKELDNRKEVLEGEGGLEDYIEFQKCLEENNKIIGGIEEKLKEVERQGM